MLQEPFSRHHYEFPKESEGARKLFRMLLSCRRQIGWNRLPPGADDPTWWNRSLAAETLHHLPLDRWSGGFSHRENQVLEAAS